MTDNDMMWKPESEFRLTEIAENLWVARHPLTFFGFKMVTCMTVVRLPSGGLWLHSPIPLGAELTAALAALGPVEYIVAPNRMHHLYALDCARQYPAARLYVAPGLAGKNAAFADFPVIPAGSEAPWAAAIDSVFVEGNPELNETVFFHRQSRYLVITDLAVHTGPWDSFGTRMYARLTGAYGRFGHSSVLKKFFKDREAARRSLQAIAQWPMEGIVLAHGPVIRRDARAALEGAFAWL
jgi:hypothetical protein